MIHFNGTKNLVSSYFSILSLLFLLRDFTSIGISMSFSVKIVSSELPFYAVISQNISHHFNTLLVIACYLFHYMTFLIKILFCLIYFNHSMNYTIISRRFVIICAIQRVNFVYLFNFDCKFFLTPLTLYSQHRV